MLNTGQGRGDWLVPGPRRRVVPIPLICPPSLENDARHGLSASRASLRFQYIPERNGVVSDRCRPGSEPSVPHQIVVAKPSGGGHSFPPRLSRLRGGKLMTEMRKMAGLGGSRGVGDSQFEQLWAVGGYPLDFGTPSVRRIFTMLHFQVVEDLHKSLRNGRKALRTPRFWLGGQSPARETDRLYHFS